MLICDLVKFCIDTLRHAASRRVHGCSAFNTASRRVSKGWRGVCGSAWGLYKQQVGLASNMVHIHAEYMADLVGKRLLIAQPSPETQRPA